MVGALFLVLQDIRRIGLRQGVEKGDAKLQPGGPSLDGRDHRGAAGNAGARGEFPEASRGTAVFGDGEETSEHPRRDFLKAQGVEKETMASQMRPQANDLAWIQANDLTRPQANGETFAKQISKDELSSVAQQSNTNSLEGENPSRVRSMRHVRFFS